MKRFTKVTSWMLVCLILFGTVAAVGFSALPLTGAADEPPTMPGAETLPAEAVWDGATVSETLAGTGTEDDPYLIGSAADFVFYCRNMATYAAEGTYTRQTADFSLNGKWHGNLRANSDNNLSDLTVAGVYDGAGHVVYNANIQNPSNYGNANSALFGEVKGTLSNLTLQGAKVPLNGSGKYYAGIALTVSGRVENCRVLDATINGKDAVGGIARFLTGTIVGCTFSGTITATGKVGGIVAEVSNGAAAVAIGDCTNYGTLTSTGASGMGGIVATISGTATSIANCRNYGRIESTVSEVKAVGVGGIVGLHSARSDKATPKGLTLDGCLNAGEIVGGNAQNVGGLIGAVSKLYSNVTVQNCGVTGNVSGAANVGGIMGKHEPWDYTSSDVLINNSYVTANVTASGEAAGLTVGNNITKQSVGFRVVNCVLVGTVSASSGAGAAVGTLNAKSASSPKCDFTNTHVYATVKAGADGKAGALIGGAGANVNDVNLILTDTKMLATVKVGDTEAVSPVAYYTGTGEGKTADVAVLSVNALTDGTARAALNTYATENHFGKWSQGTGAPVLTAFYDWPAVITNRSALSHPYNGSAVAAETKANRDDVARVEVLYYRASDSGRTSPLSGAPASAGQYVAVLRAYDASANELDAGNDFSVAFEITKAKTEIVPDVSDFTRRDDGTYLIEYTGESIRPGALLRSLVSGGSVPEASISDRLTKDSATVTSAVAPGVYVITFRYEGDGNYEPTETSVTFEIAKKRITYPENTWTVNGTDALPADAGLPYTGEKRTIRLLGADESIFAVVYANNTATDAGDAMTATATVSLRADLADYYEPVGTAPTYEWTWTVTKAAVGAVILRTRGDLSTKVELADFAYTGSTETYYVVFADANGNIVFTPANNEIVVRGVCAVERTFTWAGNENYEAAEVTVAFTVTPKKLGENGGSHADLNRTYDGNKTNFSPDFGTAPEGTTWSADYETLIERKNGDTYEKAEEALRGGEYRVTFTCVTDDGNYTASFTVTFTIARKAATITPPATVWTKDGEIYTVTYDGREYAFDATTDSDGALRITYDCDGKDNLPKVAGTYTVTVTVAASDNYSGADATYTVRVDKMVIPTVPEGTELWDYAGAFTFDGQEKRVAVKAEYLARYGNYLDCRYENNANMAAGEYTARVIFSLADTKNTKFEETAGMEVARQLAWQVNKRVLSVAGVELPDVSAIYTGSAVTTTVELPDDLKNQVNVRYEWTLNGQTYTGDAVHAGTYTVVAVLTTKDDVSTGFADGKTEYRTGAATVEIMENTATITVTGDMHFALTYNGETVDIFADMKLAGEGNTDFRPADYLVVAMTKDGAAVTEIRDAGTYLVTVSVRENGDVTAMPVTRTVTITRATYATDGKITVVGDTTYVEGKAADIALRVDVTGADGVAVTVDESRLTALPNTPGVYNVAYYLKGSENYEPLEAFTVSVTVRQASAKDSSKGDVSVIFENGADPDVKLEVEENPIDKDVKGLMEGMTFGQKITHPAVKQLYRYTFTDKDGNTVKYDTLGNVAVVITLPEKYRGYTKEALFDEISVISVTYNKGIAGKMTVEKPGNIVYDAEAGTLTLRVTSPDVAYGYVAEASPLAAYVTIGICGASLIAVIILAVVRAAGASRRTRPEGPYTPDADDAGFGCYEDTTDAYASEVGDDAFDGTYTYDTAEDVDVMVPDETDPDGQMPVPDEDTPRDEE